ncbi:hypothetical protein DdX_15926 [Ditylenchus destructor]|uniref:Uncharacterized protein n=1 Tax=Ditylenchus destructor TaxID=166010 RepID=A0AAD4MQ02_9BILA|nr:hypothetical protein DdX_15926 [Ditylenchus destructor]
MTGIFECYECHEEFDNESLPTFPNLDSLAMHIWKLHYNGNEFQHACDQCMTGFITEERLFDHLRSCKSQPPAVHEKYEKKLQVYKILNRSLIWMMEKRKGENKARAVQTEKCSTSFGDGLNTSTGSFSVGLNGSDFEVLDSGYAPSGTENGSSQDPRIASRRSSTVPNASTNGRDRSIEDIQADREQSLSALYRKAEDRIGKTKVQSPKKSKEKRPTGALTSTTPEGSPLKEEGSQMASGQMSEPNGPTAKELSAFLEDVHRGNFPTTIGINAVSERTVAPFNRYVGTAHYPKGVNNNQCASNDNSVLSTDIIDEALDQALEVRIVSNKAAAPAPVQAPVQIQAATVSDSDDDIECVGYQPGINPAILYQVKMEPGDLDENSTAPPPAIAPAQQQNLLNLAEPSPGSPAPSSALGELQIDENENASESDASSRHLNNNSVYESRKWKKANETWQASTALTDVQAHIERDTGENWSHASAEINKLLSQSLTNSPRKAKKKPRNDTPPSSSKKRVVFGERSRESAKKSDARRNSSSSPEKKRKN